MGRQYLGAVGKVDNGIVGVTILWANEQHYCPLHVLPYTPGDRFEKGKQDPAFRTKPQLALTLSESALAAGVAFKAIVADAFYGDHIGLAHVLTQRGLPNVLSHSGQKSQGWVYAELAHLQKDAAEVIRLHGLRIWVEESYKRMKDELGWADFMVRSDWAIRRHWALAYCAFAFCW